MKGAECTLLADELLNAADGKGTIISLSPGPGSSTIRHPTQLGPAVSNHHQVYTDGNFMFDPFCSPTPVPNLSYLNQIQDLNPNGYDFGIFGD
jgi:hypothetical protein